MELRRTEYARAHHVLRRRTFVHQSYRVRAYTSRAQSARVHTKRTKCVRAHQVHKVHMQTKRQGEKVCAHIRRAKCAATSTAQSARTLQVHVLVKHVHFKCTCASNVLLFKCTEYVCTSNAQGVQVHNKSTKRAPGHQAHGTCAPISSARSARVHVQCTMCARAHPVHRRYMCHSSATTHPMIPQYLGPGSGSGHPLEHEHLCHIMDPASRLSNPCRSLRGMCVRTSSARSSRAHQAR